MKKLLIIDDEAEFAGLVKAALEGEFEVTHLAGGRDAARVCRELRPDAVFLDVMMPEACGKDVLDLIQSEDGCDGIPVVALSALGRGLRAAEELAKHPGVHSFLDKLAGPAAYRARALAAVA